MSGYIKVTVTGSATARFTAVVEVPFDAEEIAGDYEGEADEYVADWLSDNLDIESLVTKGVAGQGRYVVSFIIADVEDSEIEDSSGFLLSREQQEEIDRAAEYDDTEDDE